MFHYLFYSFKLCRIGQVASKAEVDIGTAKSSQSVALQTVGVTSPPPTHVQLNIENV